MELTKRNGRLFGSRRRTEILILTSLLGDTYPSELSRLLSAPLYSVQTIIAALEREGILAGRVSGGVRRISLDPRYYAARELSELLARMAEGEPGLNEIAARRRARPRRTGKPG